MKLLSFKEKNMRTLMGIVLILFGLINLFNAGYLAQSIVIALTFIFGLVAYYLFFPILIFIGILLIIHRGNKIRIKKNVFLIGFFLFIFSLLVIFTSSFSKKTVDFSNLNSIFMESFKETVMDNSLKGINMWRYNPLSSSIGGGYLGYLFVAILNTIITPIGTIVSSSIVVIISAVLMLFEPIKFLIKNKNKIKASNISSLKEIHKNKTNDNKLGDELSLNLCEEEQQKNIVEAITSKPKEERPSITKSTAPIFNNDTSLKKASIFMKMSAPVLAPIKENNIQTNENSQKEKEATLIKPQIINNEIKTPSNTLPSKTILKPYQLPPLTLLDKIDNDISIDKKNEEECLHCEAIINKTFENFNLGAKVVGHTIGPRVTRYDIEIAPNFSVQSLPRYIPDISQRLNGVKARFVPIVTGKTTSGLEVPNAFSGKIGIKEMIEDLPKGDSNRLLAPFGKNISGELIYQKITSFPHMLVAGTSGSGKSIFIQGVLLTLLMRNTPEELQLLLVDPKRVEFIYYDELPFLLCPVISEAAKANTALKKMCEEMESRLTIFGENRTSNIEMYNKLMKDRNQPIMPYIVVVVDEFADLISQDKKVESSINRLAAKSRATGIHLIIATQRPSVDVITGTVKNNLDTRVALRVADAESSKTIIGSHGAEELLGHGDMLIQCPSLQSNGQIRAQGCFVDYGEITRVTEFIRKQRKPNYNPRFMDLEDRKVENVEGLDVKINANKLRSDSDDELYETIKGDIIKREYISISAMQREYNIGTNRAGRMYERLIKDNLVSSEPNFNRGSKVLKENFNIKNKEEKIGSEELTSLKPL